VIENALDNILTKLQRVISESEDANMDGRIEPATRDDVNELVDVLKAIRLLHFLIVDVSKYATQRVRNGQDAQAQEDETDKHHCNLLSRWIDAEPIAARVIEATRKDRFDASDIIAGACDAARSLAMNPVLTDVDPKQLEVAMTALKRFGPTISSKQTEEKTKTRRKRKSPRVKSDRPMTQVELNTLIANSKHDGNIAAMAEELGRDEKTVRENLERALNKSSQLQPSKRSRSVATQALSTDLRGQTNI